MQKLDAIQKRWLQFLEQARENETAVGALYQRYAELFPEQQETWSTLARAETAHAKLLQELLDKGPPEVAHIPLDKINAKEMAFITRQIAVMREKAATGTVTPVRAVTNALVVESLVEDFLFKAAPPGSEFSLVARLLAKESHDHWMLVDKLRQALGVEAAHVKVPSAPCAPP